MAEIVNLRRARKARQRAKDAAEADENRARHGRTKSQKQKDRLEAQQQDRLLDGAKRDHPSED